MIGQPAPEFRLPAVHREGHVSLADYRGRCHLLLAIFVGLYCPFCRRNIAQLGATREKLRRLGVETLAVVATEIDNARLYFKYRPARIDLAADPDLLTHRAYTLPRLDPGEVMRVLGSMRVNPGNELPEAVPAAEVGTLLDQKDGFTRTAADLRDIDRQWPQVKGAFLIDRDGIVRWGHIECADEGVAGLGKFPSDEELLAAARAIT